MYLHRYTRAPRPRWEDAGRADPVGGEHRQDRLGWLRAAPVGVEVPVPDPLGIGVVRRVERIAQPTGVVLVDVPAVVRDDLAIGRTPVLSRAVPFRKLPAALSVLTNRLLETAEKRLVAQGCPTPIVQSPPGTPRPTAFELQTLINYVRRVQASAVVTQVGRGRKTPMFILWPHAEHVFVEQALHRAYEVDGGLLLLVWRQRVSVGVAPPLLDPRHGPRVGRLWVGVDAVADQAIPTGAWSPSICLSWRVD